MININISNLEDRANGNYEDVSLGRIIIDANILSFADFIEYLLRKENERLKLDNRIDIRIDNGTLNKWELPFDEFCVTLYRNGYEMDKDFTSNYMYMDMNGYRVFWLDLYYSREDYDMDDVWRDILREINNLKNRDLNAYLKECEDEEI